MAKYCERCGVQVHGKAIDQPHLCKDIERRLRRRERQKEAVRDLVTSWLQSMDHTDLEWNVSSLAEGIVARLANMGVEED